MPHSLNHSNPLNPGSDKKHPRVSAGVSLRSILSPSPSMREGWGEGEPYLRRYRGAVWEEDPDALADPHGIVTFKDAVAVGDRIPGVGTLEARHVVLS